MKRYTALVWAIKLFKALACLAHLGDDARRSADARLALHDGFKYLQLQRVSKFAC